MSTGQIIAASFGLVIIVAVLWNVWGHRKHDGGADHDSWRGNGDTGGSDGHGGGSDGH